MFSNHPNATAAGISGAIATIICGTGALFGVELSAAYGAAWATLIVVVVLAVGRKSQ